MDRPLTPPRPPRARPKPGTIYRVAVCLNCDREIHTADEYPAWNHVGYSGPECPDPEVTP